ncbi:MAG: hypothetical protein RLZZ546_319 [Bacteroidota bacterium]|jgi:hypothetical protein
MSSFTVFIFRVLLVISGVILLYIIGKPFKEKIAYYISGEKVEGRIIGFRGRGSSHAILEEDSGVRKGKRKARRPVFKYPIHKESLDSIVGFSNTGIMVTFFNFHINEKVTVVKSKTNNEDAYLFSVGILFTDFLLLLLCCFMIYLGIVKKSNL